MATLFQVTGERLQDLLKDALAHPALEPSVAGLVRRVPVRQISPLGARAQDPENPVEHLPTAAPRASTSIGSTRHLANQGVYHAPLFVRQVHRCILLWIDAAYHPFMRWLVENAFSSMYTASRQSFMRWGDI